MQIICFLRWLTQKRRQCPRCKRTFRLTREQFSYSQHKIYCGDRCASGAWRKRRRQAKRQETHDIFDSLWKSGHMTRFEAYEMLAKLFQKEPQEAHIKWLSVQEMKKLDRYILKCYPHLVA